MSLMFPRSDFGSLFRLLDDYDAHKADRRGGYTSVTSFAPKFDVRELKDVYKLDGELPGIEQKDIHIEFTDPHTLVIKGRTEREYHSEQGGKQDEGAAGKAKEKEQPEVKYWLSERSVGEFQRVLSFPTRVDQDNVKASLKNGVLSVTLPKAAPPPAKRITIE